MPRIFISYRRADSKATTGRIYDRLEQAFGRDNIFMDVDDIPPGVDFRAYLQNEIKQADVVLVIIGQKWASILKQRRSDSNDFVRIELESALTQQKITIPVLIEGAGMPSASDVPERIKTVFPFLNAAQIGDNPLFHRDMDRLIETLQHPETLQPPPPPLPSLTDVRAKPRISFSPWFAGFILLVLISVGVYVLGTQIAANSANQPSPTTAIAQAPTSNSIALTDTPKPTDTSEPATISTHTPDPTNTPHQVPSNTTKPSETIEPSDTLTQTPEPTNTFIPTSGFTEISSQRPIPSQTSTPTQIPLSSPTTFLTNAVVTVNSDANLRSGPGTNYSLRGSASKGDQFNVIARVGNDDKRWYLIESDSKDIWIWGGVVDLYPANAVVGIASTIPPPPAVETSSPNTQSSNGLTEVEFTDTNCNSSETGVDFYLSLTPAITSHCAYPGTRGFILKRDDYDPNAFNILVIIDGIYYEFFQVPIRQFTIISK